MVSVSEADGSSFSAVAAGIVMAEGSVILPDPANWTLILLLARPGPEPLVLGPPRTRATPSHPVDDHAGAGADLFDEGEVRQFRRIAVGGDQRGAGVSEV